MRPRVLTHEHVAVRETLKPWPKQLPLPTTPALHVSLDTGNIVAGDIFMPGSEPRAPDQGRYGLRRSEEHTSELQSLMRISYAVFCVKKQTKNKATQEEIQKTRTT